MVKGSEVECAASPAWTPCRGTPGFPCTDPASWRFLLVASVVDIVCLTFLRWTRTFNIENELRASLRLSAGLTRRRKWTIMLSLSDCVVCVSVWIISSPSSGFEQRRKLTIMPESLPLTAYVFAWSYVCSFMNLSTGEGSWPLHRPWEWVCMCIYETLRLDEC